MQYRMSIDRYEGDRKQLAVLVSDDGELQVTMPKKMLPKGCKTGDVMVMTMERDAAATEDVARKTKAVQAELKKGDKGGDLEL